MNETLSYVFFWAGIALMGFGTVGGWFPLWKSSTTSPDSIERRVYWIGCSLASLMFGLSQIPNWWSGLFLGVGSAIALVAIAFNWTSHIKIGGRIYSAFPNLRRPDRPPVLSDDDRDWHDGR